MTSSTCSIRAIAVLAAAVLAASANAGAQPPQDPTRGTAAGQPGTVDAAGARVPAKIVNRAGEARRSQPPAGAQRVAVLSIRLDVDGGTVRAARVASSRQVASFAPKVFARRGGAWEVIIEGDTRRSFFVDDPTMREAEPHPTSNNQYQWVPETGPVDWRLVVPLYADGRPLGARAITVRDTRSGATILHTEL